MKSYITITVFAAIMTILVSGIASNAQTAKRVIATIPFEFNLGNEKLPAGQYEFRSLNRQSYPGSLIVRSMDPEVERSVIIPAMANDAAKIGDDVGLVFNRYGTSYFLSRIDLRSSDLSVRFGKTLAERKFEKRFERPVAILVPVK